MNYYEKYLKYKQKYNNLKKQYGSGRELQKIKSPLFKACADKIFGSYKMEINKFNYMTLIGNFKMLEKIFNNAELEKELNELSHEELVELQKNEEIDKIERTYRKIGEETIFELPIINSALKKLVGIEKIVAKKKCSENEFMTLDDPELICNNKTLVIGSCGYPAFFPNIHAINLNNDKIVEFLDLLMKTNTTEKKVNIILGSRNISEKKDICVTFDEDAQKGKNIDLFIKELKCGVLKTNYHLLSKFPLNTDGSNKLVLDKILEMTEKFDVEITNKMCGTCHRSLYYLVQKGNDNFTYSVDPEQKINPDLDTEDILKCFKKKKEVLTTE